MKGKHLLFVTSDFPFGSGETFIENELPYLEEAFEQVMIVSLSPDDQQSRSVGKNTNVRRYPLVLSNANKLAALRWLAHPRVLKELWRLCFVYHLFPSPARIFTILFSWDRAKRIADFLRPLLQLETVAYAYWTDDSALALAQLKSGFPKLGAMSRFHGWDLYFEASSIAFLPFRAFIIQQLNHQVAISQQGLDYATRYWKVGNSDKLLLSRLGTEKQMQSPNPKESLPAERIIVSCSNVIPLKRVGLIFDVLNATENHKIRWVHFGDGIELEELQNTVQKNVRPHLSVELRGRISNKRVLEEYRKLNPDLFINLSISEGIPVSIMEALSLGIPVLATAVGGTPEIVSDEVGALVSPEASPEDISESLSNMLNLSLIDYNRLSAQAFAFWEANYHAEKNYRSFAAWLKGM